MRAGLETETMDLFAMMSAVGSVVEDEPPTWPWKSASAASTIRAIERWREAAWSTFESSTSNGTD